jgi:hypothetical protein
VQELQYILELWDRFENKIHHSLQKVCKTWAFNFQLDGEDWIKVFTNVVAAMGRHLTDLFVRSLYDDAKSRA